MILRRWDDLPEFMKNDEVKYYYEILINKKGNLILKRVFDIVFSLILLILLSPMLIILGIWIKVDSTGPVFYRQERVTQYGKIFRIFKFRTMVINADKLGTLVTMPRDRRITRVGKKIRKHRLDEIPQLFNIFMGDMSFVGTRPEVQKYVNEYTDVMKATLLLPAGVTSEASLKFKNEDEIISKYENLYSIDCIYIEKVLPKKMDYNLKQIEMFSFWKEITICLRTLMI